MTRRQARRIRVANNREKRFAKRQGMDILGNFHSRKYTRKARRQIAAESRARFEELCASL